MTTARTACAFGLAGLVLAGCAQKTGGYTLVTAHRVPIGDAYTVKSLIAWTSFAQDNVETWTVDGFALQSLRFFKGVANGEPLRSGGKDDERRPRFFSTMNDLEIAELIIDSLYGGRLTPQELRSASLGGTPGLRFDLGYLTGDGVERRALVVGAVVKEKLQVIVYDGTALRYFSRHRDHVERLIESIQVR